MSEGEGLFVDVVRIGSEEGRSDASEGEGGGPEVAGGCWEAARALACVWEATLDGTVGLEMGLEDAGTLVELGTFRGILEEADAGGGAAGLAEREKGGDAIFGLC